MVALLSPSGGGEGGFKQQVSGYNRILKAWNDLAKHMGFASMDYHRSTNKPINPTPGLPVKATLVLSEVATVDWTWSLKFDCNRVGSYQTPAGTHSSLHTCNMGYRFSAQLISSSFLCHNTSIFSGVVWARDTIRVPLYSIQDRHLNFLTFSLRSPKQLAYYWCLKLSGSKWCQGRLWLCILHPHSSIRPKCQINVLWTVEKSLSSTRHPVFCHRWEGRRAEDKGFIFLKGEEKRMDGGKPAFAGAYGPVWRIKQNAQTELVPKQTGTHSMKLNH